MARIDWIRKLLVSLSFLPGLAGAHGGAPVPPLDVAVVMDNSGSMRENDPQRLLPRVVENLASDLPPGSRVSLVLFADKAGLLMPLTDLESGRAALTAQLARMDYSGQRTDIAAGLERGLYELRSGARPGVRGVVILLTDGVMDTGSASRDAERGRWVREDLARTAAAEQIRVFGIAFTETADFELLQSLAQTTRGGYARVLSSDGLAAAFDQLRGELVKSDAPPAPRTAASAPPSRPFPWRWVAGGVAVVFVFAVLAVRLLARRRDPVTPVIALVEIGRSPAGSPREFSQPVVRVGRSPENDLVIAQEHVSAHHAEIRFCDGTFTVRDLKSANGTALNSQRFSSREDFREVPLKHGDRIRFDAYEYEFRLVNTREAQMKAWGHSQGDTSLREEDRARNPEVAGGAVESGPGQDDKSASRRDAGRRDYSERGGPEKGPAEPAPHPAADPRRAADTWMKPPKSKCPNHKGIDATEICQVCRQLFCQYCVEEIAGETYCKGHVPAKRRQQANA